VSFLVGLLNKTQWVFRVSKPCKIQRLCRSKDHWYIRLSHGSPFILYNAGVTQISSGQRNAQD